MLTPDLGFALVIAVIMTILLAAVCINLELAFKGARLFAIIFVGIWGGGKVASPMGPLLWGVQWLTLFVAGLACAGFCLCFLLLSRYVTKRVGAQIDALSYRSRAQKETV